MAACGSDHGPPGFWTAAACGLLLCGFSGCGPARYVYTVEPLPMTVRPTADGAWGVDVAIQLKDAIHVEVVNTSEEAVQMLWSECAYVDVDGRSHRLAAVKQSAGAAAPSPVSAGIAPHSRMQEVLLPVASGLSNPDDPLLPGRPGKGRLQLPGKTVSLFLVLARNAEKRTVTAAYRITRLQKQ